MSDLLGGQIAMAFASLSSVLPHAKTGRLKIIGLVEDTKQPAAPEIPMLPESLPGFVVPRTWLGFFGPAGMPADLAHRLNAALVKAINDPAVSAKIDGSGLQVFSSSQDEFRKTMHADAQRFADIIRQSNLSVD